MPHNTSLKKADANDIPLIASLASKIWHEHYIPIIGARQVEYMLKMMYDQESLLKQMNEKKHDFYLVQCDNDSAGFLSVNKTEGQNFFLNKFYLLQDLAGKGCGTDAFKALLKLIDPKEIKLTVNRNNYKSVNFYFKLGFKIEKPVVIDIGNGFIMDDFLMVWRSKDD